MKEKIIILFLILITEFFFINNSEKIIIQLINYQKLIHFHQFLKIF